ncbi:MAG: ANTAR domain-containing protein [Burkholderiaceae bacterium]
MSTAIRRGDPVLKSLRDIRRMRVLIVHPRDRDCDDLSAQVKRIGCQVESVWPPPVSIPDDVEIVFLLFRSQQETALLTRSLENRFPRPTTIGIVEFENPTAIENIVYAGTMSIVTKPIRGFGLLTSMVIAHNLNTSTRSMQTRILKLESRLVGIKRIEQAKSILMLRNRINEQEAYDKIRLQAMKLRVSMEEISSSIVATNDMLDQ